MTPIVTFFCSSEGNPPTPYHVVELPEGDYGVVDYADHVVELFRVNGPNLVLRFPTPHEAIIAALDATGWPVPGAAVTAAAENVAATFTDWTNLSTHFTCAEADAVARLLIAAGHPIDAHHLITAHREADEDGDSDHAATRAMIEEEAPNGRCDECGAPCDDTGCIDSTYHLVAMDRDDPADAAAWAQRVAVKAAAKRIDMATRAFFGGGTMGARYVWVHSAEDGSQVLRWANRVDGSADNEIGVSAPGRVAEYEEEILDALDALRRDNLDLWKKAVTKTTSPYVDGEPVFDPDWTLFRAPYGDESLARLDLRVLAAIAR